MEVKVKYAGAVGLMPAFVSIIIILSILCILQTKSEAADELEESRKAADEEERSKDPVPSSAPPPSTSPVVFIPLPPSLPPTPFEAPPPPPPPPPPGLPKGKPSTVTYPRANTPMNPASAREAMLEAIRSGSAAERLKKVGIQKRDEAAAHTCSTTRTEY